ncbi:Las1-like protein, partial [Saccharata proteae CBS 121410]
MPRFVITPWRDGADLLQVRDHLYPPDDDDEDDDDDGRRRQHAVNLISAWKRRAALPHAVESTASLADAQLHDDPRKNSTLAIRNAYCAAFNRFVTGFCDTVQNSFRKLSMYDMAAELDMPGSFVELRHEATHEELPSLGRLRQATLQALEWLWDHYWAKL